MTDLTKNESTGVLKNNYFGNLGYISQDKPYVIPITYYYDSENHSLISYAAEGHKIDAMRKNPSVSLAVQEINSIHNWKSVLAHGTYEELNAIDAKQNLHLFREGVRKLILKKENKETEFISEFSSKLYSRGIPVVFRILISEITSKRTEL